MVSAIRLPALQALLIQLGSTTLTLLAALAVARAGIEASLLSAALVQGVVAAILARVAGSERWWVFIHLLFAPALLLLLALQLPSWIYLLLFAGMAVLYWQTFRTRVPFYPSAPAVRQAVDELLPAQAVQFVDIGSGFGGLVRDLARRRPESSFLGIELAPLPWLWSVLHGRLRTPNACFVRGDYRELDLSRFDVVFAYLSPVAMPALWGQANAQMRPGSLLLSYEFDISGATPSFAVPVGQTVLYGWRF